MTVPATASTGITALTPISLTATVATRPRAMRPAAVPPAMSTCAMIQPPKMSPFWLASAGIGITRRAGIFPSGSCSSTRLHIVQRAAAERCEAGAEDEARVHEIRVGDDALGEHRFGLSQIRLDQGVDERLVVGVGLAFDRLAVDIAVDALAGFLAEVAQRHFVRQNLRYGFDPFGQRFARGKANIKAHRVCKLSRAHRHAEVLHR